MSTFKRNIVLRASISLITLSLILSSCDQIKEFLTISFSTTIEGNIPLNIGGNLPFALNDSISDITKASVVNYDIKYDISIMDNEDIKPYLKKIKEIQVKSIQIKFIGLQQGQTIDFLNLDVIGIGTLVSLTNITISNNLFSPPISSELLKSVSDKLLNNNKITVNLKGGASGPIQVTVELKMDAKIKAQALD